MVNHDKVFTNGLKTTFILTLLSLVVAILYKVLKQHLETLAIFLLFSGSFIISIYLLGLIATFVPRKLAKVIDEVLLEE